MKYTRLQSCSNTHSTLGITNCYSNEYPVLLCRAVHSALLGVSLLNKKPTYTQSLKMFPFVSTLISSTNVWVGSIIYGVTSSRYIRGVALLAFTMKALIKVQLNNYVNVPCLEWIIVISVKIMYLQCIGLLQWSCNFLFSGSAVSQWRFGGTIKQPCSPPLWYPDAPQRRLWGTPPTCTRLEALSLKGCLPYSLG